MVVALHNYQPYLAQILGFWVTYVELKCCHYIIVEADSHLKLLPTSTLYIYKVVMVEADSHLKLLPVSIIDI